MRHGMLASRARLVRAPYGLINTRIPSYFALTLLHLSFSQSLESCVPLWFTRFTLFPLTWCRLYLAYLSLIWSGPPDVFSFRRERPVSRQQKPNHQGSPSPKLESTSAASAEASSSSSCSSRYRYYIHTHKLEIGHGTPTAVFLSPSNLNVRKPRGYSI